MWAHSFTAWEAPFAPASSALCSALSGLMKIKLILIDYRQLSRIQELGYEEAIKIK